MAALKLCWLSRQFCFAADVSLYFSSFSPHNHRGHLVSCYHVCNCDKLPRFRNVGQKYGGTFPPKNDIKFSARCLTTLQLNISVMQQDIVNQITLLQTMIIPGS